MNEDKARELAQQFGVRMCDENGETHGEELYCLGLDDIIDMTQNAYDNMLKAIDSMRPAARVIKDKPATWWLDEFEKVVRNLKDKTTY